MKIKTDHLDLFLGDKHILKDISFRSKFDSLAILGPSGSGKTSLFRVLAGLLIPKNGHVSINDQAIDFDKQRLFQYRKRLGVVFQNINLFPHLTAMENILLPLIHVHGINRIDALKKSRVLLERFQLAGHADNYPFELSGGQRQRIAIVRALAHEPDLLLLDEPTSALDPEMTMEVVSIIEQIKAENRNFILITHNVGFAKRVADQVLFLAEGKVLDSGETAKVLQNPSHPQIKNFLYQVLLD